MFHFAGSNFLWTHSIELHIKTFTVVMRVIDTFRHQSFGIGNFYLKFENVLFNAILNLLEPVCFLE